MNPTRPMLARSPDTELGTLRTLLLVVFVLAIPVALVTTTIRAVISETALYDYSVREFDAEIVSGIPEAELIRANGEIRGYLAGDSGGSLAISVTDSTGEEGALFNAREVAHMRDVRDLVQVMFTVQMLSVVLVLSLSVVMVALWPVRVLAAGLLYGAFLTGALFAVVGVLALSGFDSAWSQFHGIAFTNDLWQLDPDTDHLIQMFPEEFWFRVTTLTAGAVLLEAILIATLATVWLVFVKETPSTARELDRVPLPGRAGHSRLTGPDVRPTARP